MASRTIGGWIRQALSGRGAAAGPRIGSRVITNEGSLLGTLTALWQGTAAADSAAREDTLEVAQDGAPALYIPVSAIARVDDRGVVLAVDGTQVVARGWRLRPPWLPQS
jgi:hypothetical protein